MGMTDPMLPAKTGDAAGESARRVIEGRRCCRIAAGCLRYPLLFFSSQLLRGSLRCNLLSKSHPMINPIAAPIRQPSSTPMGLITAVLVPKIPPMTASTT